MITIYISVMNLIHTSQLQSVTNVTKQFNKIKQTTRRALRNFQRGGCDKVCRPIFKSNLCFTC